MSQVNNTTTELSIAQYLHIVRARKWLLIWSLLGAAVLSLVYTLQLPETFTAKVTLHFDMQATNPFFGQGQARDAEYLNTQVDIIRSKNVAEKVLEGLADEDIPRLQAALEAEQSQIDRVVGGVKGAFGSLFEPEPEPENDSPLDSDSIAPANVDAAGLSVPESSRPSWLASAIRGRVEVQPLFGSRIVEVAYVSAEPRVAARVANQYATAYIQTTLEMVTSPAKRTKLWFDTQLQELRKNLESAQTRLTAFQQAQGIVATEERLDTEGKYLADLSNQVVTAEADTRQLRLTVQQLEKAIAEKKSVLSVSVVFENATVQRVSADLRQLEAKQAELSAKLGVNHPQYQRTVIEIQDARRTLNEAVESVVNSVRNSVALSAEKEKRLKEAFATQKSLVLSLKDQRDQIAVLQRDVESAEAIYNTALTQFNQTNLKAVVDQTNVSIVDPATVPSAPSGPNMLKNIIIGVFVGGVLGFGLLVLFEILDRRVRSKDDIVGALDIPLLGILEKA